MMLSILKSVRETAAAVHPQTPPARRRLQRPSQEELLLRAEIDRTRWAIDSARNHFEQAVDPMLVDCYIYELNAAQLRYQFLLRTFKKQEE